MQNRLWFASSVFSLSQKTNSLFGFGQIFLAVAFVSFSFRFWFSNCRVFKFYLVFSISVLPLVKVWVNFGLWLFGESLGQVTLAQVLFSGKVQFWQSQVSKIGAFSLVRNFGKFGSGWFVKIHFASKVVFSTSKVLVSQAFLVKFSFHLVSKFLSQFGFCQSSFVFG